jgi:hypothetical protein
VLLAENPNLIIERKIDLKANENADSNQVPAVSLLHIAFIQEVAQRKCICEANQASGHPSVYGIRKVLNLIKF